MSYSKSIAIAFVTFVCATALTVDAGAQSRGGRSGGGSGGGHSAGRAPSGGGQRPSGQAAPRGGATAGTTHGGSYAVRGGPLPSRYYPNYSYGHYPAYGYRGGYYGYYGYRGYYPYYPYYGYPGFSVSLGFGYPYAYGYYGYGYPYAYAAPGYPVYGTAEVVPGGSAYGGVRVQGAPRNAEVYVDGTYAGVVDDYDGVFQRLDLQSGSHEIEIRTSGRPLVYDVNVTPGQTVTIHANTR